MTIKDQLCQVFARGEIYAAMIGDRWAGKRSGVG